MLTKRPVLDPKIICNVCTYVWPAFCCGDDRIMGSLVWFQLFLIASFYRFERLNLL